jgi:predicted nucleic-acid-binding Zn-ribbon protein
MARLLQVLLQQQLLTCHNCGYTQPTTVYTNLTVNRDPRFDIVPQGVKSID